MKKKDKEKYNFGFEISSDIEISNIHSGRIPIPEEDLEPHFTTYQPPINEAIKNLYEGLFRIWKQQGKDPMQEFRKKFMEGNE